MIIVMRINVEKCARLIVSRGRIITSADFELNSLGAIKYVHHGYKYLGIIQDMLTIDTKVKQKVIAEYHSRCRSALSSHFNRHYEMIALNCYAILVLCYSAGILNWTQAEH